MHCDSGRVTAGCGCEGWWQEGGGGRVWLRGRTVSRPMDAWSPVGGGGSPGGRTRGRFPGSQPPSLPPGEMPGAGASTSLRPPGPYHIPFRCLLVFTALFWPYCTFLDLSTLSWTFLRLIKILLNLPHLRPYYTLSVLFTPCLEPYTTTLDLTALSWNLPHWILSIQTTFSGIKQPDLGFYCTFLDLDITSWNLLQPLGPATTLRTHTKLLIIRNYLWDLTPPQSTLQLLF